jgi:hypothetical protein
MRFALANWKKMTSAEQQQVENAFRYFYDTHKSGQQPRTSGEILFAYKGAGRDFSAGRVIALDRTLSMEA